MHQNERIVTTTRKRNETKEFKVFLKGKTFKFTYNVEILKDILMSDVFSKIQIPVYVHNSTLFSDDTKKGITIVGNIISYNPEEETMKVSLFSRFASKIVNIENAIIFPRVAAISERSEDKEDREAIVNNIKILGFDIASEDFYSAI